MFNPPIEIIGIALILKCERTVLPFITPDFQRINTLGCILNIRTRRNNRTCLYKERYFTQRRAHRNPTPAV
jgi:hypothetical protein